MPFYEYECRACKFYTEVMQKISDAPLTKCPSCGKRQLKKLVSVPVFRLKGAGWYETDFKSDKESKRNLLGPEKEEAKADAKETKTEAKDSKAETKDSKAEARETRAEPRDAKEGKAPASKDSRSAGARPAGAGSTSQAAARGSVSLPAKGARSMRKSAGPTRGRRRRRAR